MKRIIVACGSGVATSQTVASKVEKLLKEKKINAKVEAVDIKSLKTYLKQSDVYISIVPAKEEVGIPVLSGIPFLTGVGVNEELEKLIKIINS
ncbi:Galactitol-specific phosphotransferase enzyme IIB component [Sebaldella termitidis]|jgi:PTS system galactitol-specific IIB component|uniref:Phosphotransferase system lactose/cellobiose-specific IIB subunit n=1 Tax=Sebaldella termitidis (strain ATCC 33386 / NCTC 11300) TaxID=526218 RepID=D1AIK7_SEBTE|nr:MULTISPECIES: PTS sugar transporter subunit IIB [Sebaldella]ACZ08591.1 phosphotransferase system lactose/cellobiose- specific IIB subunit [Sebaldella termitidis ATCC 33386]MCP1222974.1 PTS sugar transporter subunit IIB [Sebaldella sp. S0638]SUI23907.1 Galactitol-specific phosphotransferase enzyme IIB component [Sebaldella termitidis]